jgi:anti-anti-sigma factor
MGDDSIEPLREPPVRGLDVVGESSVLRLAGELDLYNADEIRSGLEEAVACSRGRVVVDLSEVEFLDSTALGVLIEARSKLGPNGLVLASPQHEIRRTLQVSGLDRQLPVYDTVDAAVAG